MHLVAVVNDILDMSRIEAADFPLHEEFVELTSILERCASLLLPQARAKQIVLHVHIDASLPSLLADERRLKQVIINLLSNAIKFTPEGGYVELSSSQIEDGSIAIVVCDNGIGIVAADLERVMQPFVQTDAALQRHEEGTGLGLSIAKGIVELHGGTLRLRSEPGHGTTATILLPPERVDTSNNRLVSGG